MSDGFATLAHEVLARDAGDRMRAFRKATAPVAVACGERAA